MAPSLKLFSARSRWRWLRSPWMAAVAMPSWASCRASRSAPRLVRVKTIAGVIWRHTSAVTLRRIGRSAEHAEAPEITGMLRKVRHLVKVEET
jgi:ribosomal protein L30/L7E